MTGIDLCTEQFYCKLSMFLSERVKLVSEGFKVIQACLNNQYSNAVWGCITYWFRSFHTNDFLHHECVWSVTFSCTAVHRSQELQNEISSLLLRPPGWINRVEVSDDVLYSNTPTRSLRDDRHFVFKWSRGARWLVESSHMLRYSTPELFLIL